MVRLPWLPLIFVHLAINSAFAADNINPAQLNRGKLLYLQHCVICHQSSGQGAAGTFPPLAKSDFMMADKDRSIRTVVEGLSDSITVNGAKYDNAMPPVVLTDAQVADVLTYVRNAFGNQGDAVTAAQVGDVRAKTRFPTYEALVKASAYPPLPSPPEGWSLRELVRLPSHGSRLASDPTNLFVLGERGDIWRVSVAEKQITQIIQSRQYCSAGSSTLGFTFEGNGRLYVAANHRIETQPFFTNEVIIYRSASTNAGAQFALKPWLRLLYPWGIGPFNHGVSHIAFGPDGFLYVSSGSRTDGNEAGTDPKYFTGGEVSETACIWRLDASQENPKIDIYARGLRNAYGFCWTDKGEMWATDNGPDADTPEEVNRISKGAHYGFPYQFSNGDHKPYPYTPDPPAGVRFTFPLRNTGPAAGATSDAPVFTVNPHSSPAGIVYLGAKFPAAHRDTLLLTRFGNLLKKPKDAGFDLLQVRLDETQTNAQFTTVLAPLGRPLDLHLLGTNVYLLEYSRQTNNAAETGMLAGRILELSPSSRHAE